VKEMSQPIRLKYFNLGNFGGRGGVVRFALLANNIPFTNDFIAEEDWPAEKAKLIASGLSPGGYMPVVYDGDKVLTEHQSISRYYSKQAGSYGKDASVDYAQDAAAESMKEWRADWVVALLGNDEAKQKYTASLAQRYATLDANLAKSKGLSGGFSVGDAAVFGQVHDDRQLGNKIDLSKLSYIQAVIDRALKTDGIKKWNEEHGKPF
jgi:glutathione S-transferase